MWRSDCESRILNTYVPAGNTFHPVRWTPGISTGPLKVITVLLFHASAFAPGENTAPISAKPNTVVVTVLKTLICFFSFFSRNLRGRIFALSGAMPANLGWLVAHDERRSIPRTIGTLLREKRACRPVPGPCLLHPEEHAAQRQG